MRKISYYYPIYKPSAFSTKIPYGLILEFIPNSNFKGAWEKNHGINKSIN